MNQKNPQHSCIAEPCVKCGEVNFEYDHYWKEYSCKKCGWGEIEKLKCSRCKEWLAKPIKESQVLPSDPIEGSNHTDHHEDTSVELTVSNTSPMISEEVVQKPVDPYDQIDLAVKSLRFALENQLENLEKSLRDNSGDVHSKVADREKIVKRMKLDKKLITLFHEIKYYPIRANEEDDLLASRLCEIDSLEREEHEKELHIKFSLNDLTYCFIYIDGGSSTDFDGDYCHYTSLLLRDNLGKLLIGINISIEYDGDFSELRPF